MDQNTTEWLQARAGKITASRMCDVMAFGKRDGKPLKSRQDYIGDIVAELLTGEPKEQVKARPLDWGHDVEAAARVAYEAETGEVVQQVGFLTHSLLPYIGCSPDGLIGGDGQMQIKCPNNPAVHIATLRDGMPEEHIAQVQGEMFVTGRAWSDFVSFDPRMPEHLRLYRQRIKRDEAYIEQLAAACESLWAEVQTYITYLNEKAA
ncbi:lambda exonuclease family protein [Frateuria terrea]|uniref:Putative phage-type endonuclease n=1 Tax=Frateuria terrea TaxID=529704 RepID=A0A1H6ZMZ3_9GAMM|nr:lambda exonuclease family protein [Frateuria terrea]SEJ54779.1 putative phage-type endonuclease [Frateuria terrea]SFP47670.1 putative phage-type endonuclease [Frateuria terrea]